MGGPKGNKHGVGHGRPPLPGNSRPELEILGKELLAWMAEEDKKAKKDTNHKPILHLSQWYSGIRNISRSNWETIRQNPGFLPYYEKALEWLGVKMLGNEGLPTAYGSRFLSIYFKDVRVAEREAIEHKIDYEIKKKQDAEIDKGIAPLQDSMNAKALTYQLLNQNRILQENNDQLKKELDDLKPKASQELQRSDSSI